MENNILRRNITYKVYYDFLIEEMNKVLDSDFTGADAPQTVGLWNSFFLLMQMRYENYASARPTVDDVECMRLRLACLDINTIPMEGLWPPSYDPTDGEEWDPEDLPDGIGNMQIEGLGVAHPIFRISPNS